MDDLEDSKKQQLPEPTGASRAESNSPEWGERGLGKKDREERKMSGGHTVKAAALSLFSTVYLYSLST